jgi:hypothetical protein
MASLVGKWVRDLLMRRIVRYHQSAVPDLPEASGYHDPVTTRFIEATALTRKKAKIDDECFVRRAISDGRATSSAPGPAPKRASPSASRSPRPS